MSAGTAVPLRVYTSALAGERDYVDEGCDLAPSCLACPFPSCRYDLRGGAAQALRRWEQRRAVAELHREGLSVHQITERIGVPRRTVYRWLAAQAVA